MLAVVSAIYDAGLDPALWPAALERIAAMLDTTSAAIGLLDLGSRVAFRAFARTDEQAVLEYADHYRLIDPVFKAVSSRPAGRAFSDEMILPKTEVWRSRLYHEWCRPHDMEHAIQAFAARSADYSAAFTLGRPRRKEAFSSAEVDVATMLLPHVARAFRVQTRLHAAQLAEERMAAALDRVPQGVMLVDARARVLHANRAAATLLESGHRLDGGPLGLRASCPKQTDKLIALIARASGFGLDRVGGSMVLSEPGGTDRLVAHVVPCRGAEVAWVGGVLPTAIVIVAKPSREGSADVESALQTLFGLTPAEARTARLVAGGIGVDAAAAALGAKPSTVRTHLVRAYHKTGTGRQAELAELVGQVASAVGSGSGHLTDPHK